MTHHFATIIEPGTLDAKKLRDTYNAIESKYNETMIAKKVMIGVCGKHRLSKVGTPKQLEKRIIDASTDKSRSFGDDSMKVVRAIKLHRQAREAYDMYGPFRMSTIDRMLLVLGLPVKGETKSVKIENMVRNRFRVVDLSQKEWMDLKTSIKYGGTKSMLVNRISLHFVFRKKPQQKLPVPKTVEKSRVVNESFHAETMEYRVVYYLGEPGIMNVRKEPSIYSEAIGKIYYGDVVHVHEESNGWISFRYGERIGFTKVVWGNHLMVEKVVKKPTTPSSRSIEVDNSDDTSEECKYELVNHKGVTTIDLSQKEPENECPVCYEDMSAISFCTFNCGHKVCLECYSRMVKQKECPCCRGNVM